MVYLDRRKNLLKDETGIYRNYRITITGSKHEVMLCNEFLETSFSRSKFKGATPIIETIDLLTKTYPLYKKKYPNALGILTYAMDVVPKGILNACPYIKYLDDEFEAVGVVLDYIDTVRKNRGYLLHKDFKKLPINKKLKGVNYQVEISPQSFLRDYQYKYENTKKCFTLSHEKDTIEYELRLLRQINLEQMFDNKESYSDRIDFIMNEFYDVSFDFYCSRVIGSGVTKYNNTEDPSPYTLFNNWVLFNKIFAGSDIKNKAIATFSCINATFIPLDDILGVSHHFPDVKIAVQYIGSDDYIRHYVFHNGDILDSYKDKELSEEFLYYLSSPQYPHLQQYPHMSGEYMKHIRYLILNNIGVLDNDSPLGTILGVCLNSKRGYYKDRSLAPTLSEYDGEKKLFKKKLFKKEEQLKQSETRKLFKK